MRRLQSIIIALVVCLAHAASGQTNNGAITVQDALAAQKLFGLEFSDAKIELMLRGLNDQLESYAALRQFPLSNSVPPALQFNPVPAGMQFETARRKVKTSSPGKVKLPANPDELAFYSVGEMAVLLRTRQITSEQLTRFFLERIERYGPALECVVTVTAERALAEARRADREISAGRYRGLLHGIPYAAKDLFATRGIPTTWGAAPFTNQVFEFDATVIRRLESAGAVLLAKTTLGELAMGDVWFGGRTRNPWNREQGSSGSSAGSAAGVAAGLFPFALGSETYGSIVSPSDRCGVTGFRPTYGRVSRYGAMTLSWSMDKVGPIGRTVEDCAIVFNAIHGPDALDDTVRDLPFNYTPKVNLKKLRIGYLKEDFEKAKGERLANDGAALKQVRALGAELIPVQLPDYPVGNISFVLSTEAAAAFDELTRSGQDEWLKQQQAGSWPNTFRRRRFVPAVEYIQAQRIRQLLVEDMARLFERVDVIIAPTFGGRQLLLSNLTGHPCVVVPNGFSGEGVPTSICFLGRLYGEAELLGVAKAYQDATGFHRMRPPLE